MCSRYQQSQQRLLGPERHKLIIYVYRDWYFIFVPRVYLSRYKFDIICMLCMLLNVTQGYLILLVDQCLTEFFFGNRLCNVRTRNLHSGIESDNPSVNTGPSNRIIAS